MTNSKGKKRHVNGKELSQALKTNDALFVDFLNRCLEWVWRIGSSLFRKLESSPTHRRNKIPYILCTRHKVSPWQSMQNPIGERQKIPQLTQHRSSTRDVRGEVNKWYGGLLSRQGWIRNWPQSSAVNCSSDLHQKFGLWTTKDFILVFKRTYNARVECFCIIIADWITYLACLVVLAGWEKKVVLADVIYAI